jgi:ABC-type branched-subunit amino acid transport system substrate-binding protein
LGRGVRIAAFTAVLTLVVAACGSRVVPLDINAIAPNGQPIANPSATGSAGSSVGPSVGASGGPGNSGLPPGLPGTTANCRGGATDKGVTATTIKVGLVGAKTGSFPGQFDPNIEAVDAYLKMINAAGGVCHRAFQLYIRDDGGNRGNDETRALELAKEVGIFAFVGSISAPDSDGGVAKVSRDYGIPDIGFPLSYERSESRLTYGVPGQLQRNLIGVAASGSEYLNRLYGVKQVAILWVGESLVSKANAWGFEAAMLKSSEHNTSGRVKICFEQESNVFDNSFSTYAQRMGAQCDPSRGPLAVYTTMENSNNVKLADAMLQQGVQHKVYAPTFTSYLPSFTRDERGNPRKSTDGAFIAMPQIPFERCASVDSRGRPVPPCSHPELDRYVQALRRFEPGFKTPGSFGAPGWGQAALFVQAVAKCGGNLTRKCVLKEIDAIPSFSDNGFLSPTRPSDHKIYSSDLLVQVRNGKFVEVQPNNKGGPPGAPDFWDVSHLFDWWDYFCDHKSDFPDRSEIDRFVTSCPDG